MGCVLLSIAARLLVWNPSTRESIELPRLEYSRERCTYGLGYDSTSDDYKILKFHFDGSEILALKSGSWRYNIKCRVGFEPSLNLPVDSLAFLHGAFHWVCYVQKIFVVTFSISDEVFGKMQMLEPMLEKVDDFTNYGVSMLGGMLCFYCAHCAYSNPSESTFKLWLMKDYSVKESWILSYTIQDNDLFFLKPIQDKDLLDLFFLRPIHMFADGEVLLNYRCIDHVGSNLPFRTSKGPFGLWLGNNILKQEIIYTENLISPKSLI